MDEKTFYDMINDITGDDYKNYKNLIGNVYQAIGCGHTEKVEIIAEWLESLRKIPLNVSMKEFVQLVIDNCDYIRQID